jgi:hypothetical protein
MIKIKKDRFFIIFSLFGTVVVLWQLLGHGYVLSLDMIFGPHVDLIKNPSDFLNTFPVWYILDFFTLIFNGWIAQKIFLIAILFLAFYFPLHFFKKIFNLENTYGSEYIVSLFFVINPFVYERFLSGQWLIILGYVLLVPITSYLIDFCREFNNKSLLKFTGVVFILALVSIHILTIVLIIIFISLLINLIYRKFNLFFFKKSLLLGLAVLVSNSYWLIGAFLKKATPMTSFGVEHWEAFKTVGKGYFGTIGNVLTLNGFWLEGQPWAERFLFMKDNGWMFVVSFILFILVIIYGIYVGLKDKKLRLMVLLILFIAFLSVVFSCGIGEGIFRNFNMWMFEHIPFWKGFRDSQKWSAVIALSYALFTGLGGRFILSKIQKIEYRRIIFYILLSIPILYTPMMLFGFAGQLKTVEYPASWQDVNGILKEDKNCRALFLTWQQYYYLKFNNNLLTANLSHNFFDCDIIHGKNMEFGGIRSQGGNGEEYDLIEQKVWDNNANIDDTINLLKERGIKYIIFTDDILGEDPYLYLFLNSKSLKKVIHSSDGVYLYEIY